MAYTSWSVSFGEQPSATKWNILGTNDAYFDSVVGSGTAWTSFTPSYTSITVGSGTSTGHYLQIGKIVFYKVKFVYGSGSSVGASPSMTLPVAENTNSITSGVSWMGVLMINDSGTTVFEGHMRYNGSQAASFIVNAVTSTYPQANGISSTIPMTWTTNDGFSIQGHYEAA